MSLEALITVSVLYLRAVQWPNTFIGKKIPLNVFGKEDM